MTQQPDHSPGDIVDDETLDAPTVSEDDALTDDDAVTDDTAPSSDTRG